jgi:hypothetical protein
MNINDKYCDILLYIYIMNDNYNTPDISTVLINVSYSAESQYIPDPYERSRSSAYTAEVYWKLDKNNKNRTYKVQEEGHLNLCSFDIP